MHEDLFHAVSYGKNPDAQGECEDVDKNAILACLNPCPFCDEDAEVFYSNRDRHNNPAALLTFKCCNYHNCSCAFPDMDVGKPHSDPLFAVRYEVVDEIKVKKAIMSWNHRPTALTSFAHLTKQFINAVNRRAALRDKIHGAEHKQSGYESGAAIRKLLEGSTPVSAPSVPSRDAARDLREALDCPPRDGSSSARSREDLAEVCK